MKTQYVTATSLDGFIATEDDSLEWLVPFGDINDTGYSRFIAQVGTLAMGDVRPVHAQMGAAAQGKNIWIVGGGNLAGQFFDAGLLDEALIQVGSVTLGKGKPLFPRRATNPPWKLLSVRQVGAGFAELHYEIPRSIASSAA